METCCGLSSSLKQLRQYVLRRAKIKMLNWKKMIESMFASLTSAYVNAIPNIDITWNYMCKSE